MEYPKLMPGQLAFSTFDTAKIHGELPATFKTLMANGVITGGTKVQWGSGYRSVFGMTAQYRIGAFFRLKHYFRNDVAARLAQGLCVDDFAGILIVGKDRQAIISASADQLAGLKEVVNESETAVVVNLLMIKASVDAAIERFYKN
ncbi:MAG: hypothetical protein WA081_19590 [Desulfosalsimonadaceae bacterium]